MGESRNCCSQWACGLEKRKVDQKNWKMEGLYPLHILNIYNQKGGANRGLRLHLVVSLIEC